MKHLSELEIAAAGILWGTMGLFVRQLNEAGLSSLDAVTVRALSTTVLLALILLVRDRRLFRIRLRDVWILLGTAFFDVVFFNSCYFLCISLTNMPVAAVLLYTSPVFVMLFSALFYGERITAGKTAGIALTVLGCALVTGAIGGGGLSITLPGLLAGLGAALGFSLYPTFGRKALERGMASLTITFYTFAFASVMMVPLTDWGEVAGVFASDEPAALLLSAGTALVPTVLPYLLYNAGLRHVENSRASIIAALEPVTASILGVLVYRDPMTPTMALGVLVVLAAIVIMNRSGEKQEVPEEKSRLLREPGQSADKGA